MAQQPWQKRAEALVGTPPGIIREVETAVDEAAGMAVRILMRPQEGRGDRGLLEDQLAALAEGYRRRAEHALAYDGQLEAARALAVSVLCERLGAGTEKVLSGEYGLTFGEDE